MTEEINIDNATLEQLRDVLTNKSGDVKLANRFRALFNLKCIGAESPDQTEVHKAIEYIAECFKDDSELLKHEVAYVLGQTHNLHAAPYLREVLKNDSQQCMVRHEAAEALGALGDKESLDLLEDYWKNDPLLEIRQTCELAIERIKWENSEKAKTEILEKSAYTSIDPAPPMATDKESKVEKLQYILNNQDEPLFERYRAMFRLRDLGTDEACLALATGFSDPSALFKHEIAYVFGQLCNPVTVPSLIKVLKDSSEAGMVRHEAAEALGSIATDECLPVLQSFLNDKDEVVRDSAIVALDMYEYENSNELEYATVN
ncbi:phycocyanin alpha-subunit phycocyanobilin lyase [Suhomyces tanzawaensis NRRL Y-17324]|uniref:Deoxyhypusine hydroxylase n=1 Tax=Suhomyces tanzawaensis NRRL Y-17324 TaxID=984487 RepID=A0A1E4SKZ0_9ASCO|nr:phycocyanin alpha-subunit phycocyanobilin lyase [Suhomyces tanzawaensis NRRL Y-17324]ODV80164.1 phycocyanin alpha-subunit phycocyanobilin lyase [Suhomyces tanzawaensis NRRL Y-17324]